MPLSRNRYVNALRGENGYHEGRDPDGDWNNYQKFSPAVPGLGWSQYQAWCHTFASWGAVAVGDSSGTIIPITASCVFGVDWFKRRGRWTEYPVLGGPFYMGDQGEDHVGVVYAYDADYIYTIEGNTNSGGSYQGDGVYERKRPRRGAGSPYGYGVPAFDEGTISADPALGGTKAASVPRINSPQEDPLPSPADVFSYKVTTPEGGQVSVGTAIAWMDHRHNVVYGELQSVKDELAAVKKQLAAILAAVKPTTTTK